MTKSRGLNTYVKKVSLPFLYTNPIGKFLLTEEVSNLWTNFSNPYKNNDSVRKVKDALEDIQDPLRRYYMSTIPHAKIYRGLLLQGYLVSPKFLSNMEDFSLQSDDIFLVSYPRSGTTWTEEVLSCITSNADPDFLSIDLHERVVHLEVGAPFRHESLISSMASPRLLATHLPFQYCPKQLRNLKCKIIMVVRNPKDQLVSYYHFHETAGFLGHKLHPWNKFFDCYLQGHLVYGSWFEHTKGWWKEAKKHPDTILVISYEEMQIDLSKMVKIIGQFLGKPVNDDMIPKILNHCSFKNMKSNKAVNRSQVPVKGLFNNEVSGFMRSGRIGDWQDHFTPGQNEIFDEFYQNQMESTGLRLTFTVEETQEVMASEGRVINQLINEIQDPFQPSSSSSSSSPSPSTTPTTI